MSCTYSIISMSDPYCEWLFECYVSVKDLRFAQWLFWGFKSSVMWLCVNGQMVLHSSKNCGTVLSSAQSHIPNSTVACQNTWIHMLFVVCNVLSIYFLHVGWQKIFKLKQKPHLDVLFKAGMNFAIIYLVNTVRTHCLRSNSNACDILKYFW